MKKLLFSFGLVTLSYLLIWGFKPRQRKPHIDIDDIFTDEETLGVGA